MNKETNEIGNGENKLSVEQLFEVAKMNQSLQSANAEELRELFIEFYKLMLLKDNAMKKLLLEQWGLTNLD